MHINLSTPLSDDKEMQRRNEAVLDAIERHTEERMNDAYGRIHTDGSRSGGQPIPSEDCPKCERFGDDCGEHSPSWQELAAYWKAEAERLRQPTQSNIFDACDVQKHTLIVDPSYTIHAVEVKSLDDSQPTQSDALREENERLRALLARTVNLAEVYAEGTGANFKEAMAEARAALQEQSK